MSEDLIEFEAMELESSAHWRSEKAAEHPDDSRNTEAARLLTHLAVEIRKLRGTAKAEIFEKLHDFVFNGAEEENPHDVSERWREYRSRIGFDNFPNNAEEYLDSLMEIARDAA